jgi:hypothetical protein
MKVGVPPTLLARVSSSTRIAAVHECNVEAVAKIKKKAAQRAIDLKGIIEGIERSGATSVRAITHELNRQGISAPRGGFGIPPPWRVFSIASREHSPAFDPHLRPSRSKHAFPRSTAEGKIFRFGAPRLALPPPRKFSQG